MVHVVSVTKADNVDTPPARADAGAGGPGAGGPGAVGAADRPTIHAANREALAAWCDLSRAVESFRARWKPSILMALTDGPRPMSDLRAALTAPAKRVLVRALRELEADRLVERRGPEARPLYALTADGTALARLLSDLASWEGGRAP